MNRKTIVASYWNGRRKAVVWTGATAILLLTILVVSVLLPDQSTMTNLTVRNVAPSWAYLFGTDWLGRDMLIRTLKGLGLSIQVGLLGATISTVIAVVMGLVAAVSNQVVDRFITSIINLLMSVPHLVLLILISFVCGGGMKGIVIGIMVTHWAGLARIIRAEAMQAMTADYIVLAKQFGRSRWWIARKHVLPHVIPQIITGFILLFPHAILHEAALTFLGLGLSPHQPAIGIILSEAMRYLTTGHWWLAVFPGALLLLVVRSFDRLGEASRVLLQARQSQK
ncbi:ABC transporter permease [Paenibacillus yanchengensis]|uniref:ABC transporter permease n=1 Tax=Paenibacillus yanchengensis TaxID=2035833 RepID=A0ABW4YGS8_9BACL